jgi:hypothetical protein
MKSLRQYTCITIVLITFLSVQLCNAQANVANGPENLAETILYHDSIFWSAYDACDVEKMSAYFTDDIEFYHDKNGLTTSKVKLDEAMRTGLCGNPNWHLRREAIEGTINIFPMDNFGAFSHYRKTKLKTCWSMKGERWSMS